MFDSKNHPILEKKEEQELFRVLKSGNKREKEKAREKLIVCNQRLVYSIAKNYFGKGMDLDDLVQEGNIGLLKVVERFELSRGLCFSTYATFCIRQCVTESIRRLGWGAVAIPGHVGVNISKMNKTRREFEEKHGREMRSDEIARELGMTVENVELAKKSCFSDISMDEPVSDDDETLFSETLTNESQESVFDEVVRKEKGHMVDVAVDGLNSESKHVLISYYGLGEEKEKGCLKIGKEMGIQRQKVHKILNKGLDELRVTFPRNCLV